MDSHGQPTSPESSQECPICEAALPQNLRYPFMLCGECMDLATDASGRKLEFSNLDATGGFQAHYADTGEEYPHHACVVRGVQCHADEAHFGGIVIQPLGSRGDRRKG